MAGLKSKMRSMQRGAHYRDSSPPDRTPDYANFDPIMSKAEQLHFGTEGAQRDEFLRKLEAQVKAALKAGLGKPADLSRLLNRAHMRTFVADQWTPRLCWFLKKELAAHRRREADREEIRREAEKRYKREVEKRRQDANPKGLSEVELRRRTEALKAFRTAAE